MSMTERDRRLLKIWGVMVVLAGVYFAYTLFPDTEKPATADGDSVKVAEQRLARLKEIAATAPAKQDILKKVSADLAAREKGLIQADTAQQAQAQILTKVRQLLVTEGIEIRSTELGAIEPLADSYGLAPVGVQFECRVEQLLNLLAGLATQPELITTRDYQIMTGSPKDKTVRVRLVLGGLVPKSLVPEKKKGAGL